MLTRNKNFIEMFLFTNQGGICKKFFPFFAKEINNFNISLNKHPLQMSSNQRRINSFFQRQVNSGASSGEEKIVQKSPSDDLKRQHEEYDKDTSPGKKIKLAAEAEKENEKESKESGDSTVTTSDQKIEEKRLAAKSKLVSKQTFGLVSDIGPTWFKALEAEFNKPYFLQLSKFVSEERKKCTVFPPPEDVFSWTRMKPISDIKVVILGQDPYHGPRQAHGLCFSVQKGVAVPPSLENMYKELKTDIGGFSHPGHGDLSGWAEQGVLLLNAVLTVQAHNANSHKDRGWEKFTDAVISWLNVNTVGAVFMLWGAYAQKKGACINKTKHHILQTVHPSPLSVHRGFFGCKHFSRCNELLEKQGSTPIDWKHLP